MNLNFADQLDAYSVQALKEALACCEQSFTSHLDWQSRGVVPHMQTEPPSFSVFEAYASLKAEIEAIASPAQRRHAPDLHELLLAERARRAIELRAAGVRPPEAPIVPPPSEPAAGAKVLEWRIAPRDRRQPPEVVHEAWAPLELEAAAGGR